MKTTKLFLIYFFLFFGTIIIYYNLTNKEANNSSAKVTKDNTFTKKAEEKASNKLAELLKDGLSKHQNNENYEKAANQLFKLIEQEKFDEVEKQFAKFIKEQKITRDGIEYPIAIAAYWFYPEVRPGEFPEEMLPKLNKWIETYPKSAMAYYIRGYYYMQYGWEIRGGGFANEVKEETWKLFGENIKLSNLDLQKSYELDKSIPYALQRMIALNFSSKRWVEPLFRTIIKDHPNFYFAYTGKLISLMPKWGGSWQEMFGFAKETAKNAPPKSLLPLVLANAHKEAGDRSKNKEQYYNSENVWQEIEESYKKVINDFPNNSRWRADFAEIASEAGKLDIAKQYIVEALVTAPHNKKLYNETFSIFGKTGEYKAQEIAMREYVRRFPNDEWGYRKLGSSLLMQNHKFDEIIDVISKSIDMEGESWWKRYALCFAYNRTEQYEKALLNCNKAVSLNSQNHSIYYERGNTYYNLGQQDKADYDHKIYRELSR